jgi:hypothetical protein
MADIALTTAERIEIVESTKQMTAPAGEAITAGAPVRFDATTRKFVNGNGTTATEAAIYGIATRTVIANEAVTAVKIGVLDGFNFDDQDAGDPIYVSDTDARLADAAGTVSVRVGTVISAWGQPLGTGADKLLDVNL